MAGAKGRVLILGAGGVGRVVTHKCCQVPHVFEDILLASRTLDKCEKIRAEVSRPIRTAQVDADNVPELVRLIREFQPYVVINVALPYQDLHVMDACLETGVHYLDTANYEPPEEARFSYEWQWPYHEPFARRGIMGLLGSGFDPGVTNVFIAWARKHLFDRIRTIDIVDCNAGDHGYPFATNFNPEINIREVTAEGRWWENGEWKTTPPLCETRTMNFPAGIGPRKLYLMYHEELESLTRHIEGLERIRFWMTFSDRYLAHLFALQNVGMTRIDPVDFDGRSIVPLKFLKRLLPDPAELGPRTRGKTCIGCIIQGEKDGAPRRIFIYNVCDHQECRRETRSQAVSYTTGVPAMIGAMLMTTGKWFRPGVWNMEQLDPDPFMDALNRYGLPWAAADLPADAEPLAPAEPYRLP